MLNLWGEEITFLLGAERPDLHQKAADELGSEGEYTNLVIFL